ADTKRGLNDLIRMIRLAAAGRTTGAASVFSLANHQARSPTRSSSAEIAIARLDAVAPSLGNTKTSFALSAVRTIRTVENAITWLDKRSTTGRWTFAAIVTASLRTCRRTIRHDPPID